MPNFKLGAVTSAASLGQTATSYNALGTGEVATSYNAYGPGGTATAGATTGQLDAAHKLVFGGYATTGSAAGAAAATGASGTTSAESGPQAVIDGGNEVLAGIQQGLQSGGETPAQAQQDLSQLHGMLLQATQQPGLSPADKTNLEGLMQQTAQLLASVDGQLAQPSAAATTGSKSAQNMTPLTAKEKAALKAESKSIDSDISQATTTLEDPNATADQRAQVKTDMQGIVDSVGSALQDPTTPEAAKPTLRHELSKLKTFDGQTNLGLTFPAVSHLTPLTHSGGVGFTPQGATAQEATASAA